MKRHIFCLASLLLLHGAANAALSFKVRADTVNRAGDAAQNAPANSSVDMQVVLGDSHISVRTEKTVSIYDFAKRRRIEIDRAAKTYVDYSLYATVGFRDMEIRNRAGLARIMTAVPQVPKMNTPLQNQQVLSVMPQPPLAQGTQQAKAAQATPDMQAGQEDAPELLAAETAGMTRYSIAGTELLLAATQGKALGQADARQFVQFLRYYTGGHPLLLRKLEQQASIPATARFNFHEFWGGSERTLVFSAIVPATAAQAAGYDLSGYSKRAATQPDVDQLLDKAANGSPFGSVALQRKLEGERLQAFADKRGMDAMLLTTELMFVSGEFPGRATPEQLAIMQGDENQRRLAAAIQVRNKRDLPAAIATLQALRTQTTRPHLLKIFEANHHAALGDLKTATTLFTEALQANPQMASAYKDLGDTFLRGFDMERAWRCWDIGRRMAPRFTNFGVVNQFETTLAKNYPEYF